MNKNRFTGFFIGAFIGMLAVYMVIEIAAAGYKFGQYLAQPTASPAPKAGP